jgi:hypothetical protein
LYTWGKGDWGRLGHNSNSSQTLPKLIDPVFFHDTEISKCSFANNISGALTKDGKIYMFGKNEAFQLGVESSGSYYGGGQFDGVLKPTLFKFFSENNIIVKDFACGDKLSACVTRKYR